jgi:alpha-mannosidase
MDRYPDFKFNQSSAQAYAWIEEDDPAVFARIKKRVAEGRWDPVGGMWLESDCNVTGGEAFVRQLFYGQQYFLKTFGRRHQTAWLPDVFGFSGGIPQLLRGADLIGFFTIKLNWNEENRFPYDLFEWEGIDGSRVNANLFFNPGEGYNGNIVPLDTLGTWREHRGKTLYPKSLLAFGWGDGAGGPTEKMLENYARIKEFPMLPRLSMGKVDDFFAGIPDSGLPRWVGELYLELHRGTLTSQAKTKELNRASEHRLLEAEAFSTIAALSGSTYPRAEIDRSWKMLLLNQFHDILPGSSIHEVYEVTERELAGVVATASEIRDAALSVLGGNGAAGSDRTLVANAGIADRPLQLLLPGDAKASVSGPDGAPLPTQATDKGVLVGGARVPGLGWTTLIAGEGTSFASPGGGSAMTGTTAKATKRAGASIENDLLLVEIGADGAVSRIFDKQAGREALAGRANQLWAYVDKPRSWDAWDVDETYERDGEEIIAVSKITVTETGPLRASVRVERTWRASTIVQTYRLWTDSRRLDIETEIDWHQRQVLLKALFPLNVRSDHAVFETMFGVVSRATHRNTSWDQARFEGAAHRFADLAETGYGVAVLNNAKYAYGIHDNVLNLSLLRGPMYPDALADEGAHRFTYSIYPHPGDWTEAGVVAEAFALNSPLIVGPAGRSAARGNFIAVSGLPVGLGSLKLAESGDGAILRIYEPHGGRGTTTLGFDRRVKSAQRVNLLEEPQEGAAPAITEGFNVSLALCPFEVATLKLGF